MGISYLEDEPLGEEGKEAALQFSRKRALPLTRDDTIRPISDLEADSHDHFYDLLKNVGTDTIAPIKQDWIYNVCCMAGIDSFTSGPKVIKA